MTRYCPDCYAELPSTRRRADGRCDRCRPRGKRRHSEPRQQLNEGLDRLIAKHRGASQ